jgi:hypothetical protein
LQANLLRLAVRKVAAVVFLAAGTLVFALPARGQGEPALVPGFLLQPEPRDAQEPGTLLRDLPDAPRKPPLEARRLTLGERLRIYRHSVFNPDSALAPAFGAALAQANNEPPEWGQGANGFGTRLASGYGRLVINRSIRFGVAALDHEDPRFTYSNQAGFWRRFRYASVHYVMARTDEGGQMPAFSRFAGAYGAAFIANSWYPESRANTGHALMRGSTALAAGYAWNVFREFWPDIKKAIQHRRSGDEEPKDPNN